MKNSAAINSRERVKRVIRWGIADRVPKGELCINDDIVCRATGSESAGFSAKYSFIQYMGLDLVSLSPVYPHGLKRLPETTEYTWPHIREWTQTPLFTFAVLDGAFEWGMRIFYPQKFFVLLGTQPQALGEFVRCVEKLNLNMAERLASEGVDAVIIADDIAHQKNLFTHPHILRTAFFPSLGRQVEKMTKLGLPVFFHSDGNYGKVLDDLLNLGFTGFQCLEKNAEMNINELQKKYGKRACLWGHLDANDILQAADSDNLKKLHESISHMAERGKFLLGTTSGLFHGMDIDLLRRIYQSF